MLLIREVLKLASPAKPKVFAERIGPYFRVFMKPHRKTLYISLRTTHDNAQAGDMLRKAVGGKGKAGGHEMTAGGQIPLKGLSQAEKKVLEESLFKRLFALLGLPADLTPFPLIAECDEPSSPTGS